MKNQQTLILDLDDTLIHCNKYFNKSREEFVKKMKNCFVTISKEEIIKKQLEFDLKSVEKHGFHSSGYPESLVSTYLYFCRILKRQANNDELEQIRKIGEKVFEIEVEPFPNMYKVLDELLKDGHYLYLFTGGDKENQFRKIDQLGLEDYFKKIYICEHKNTKALKKVLTNIKSDKKSTWMIGNSLKTDIMPAIEHGINSIHIPPKIEWSYNIIDINIEPKGTFAELKSLLDLPDFLREHSYCFEAIH